MKKDPETFIGFCCVNPVFKDKAVKEMERCLDLGFKGMGKVMPDVYRDMGGWTRLLDDAVSLTDDAKKSIWTQHLHLWI